MNLYKVLISLFSLANANVLFAANVSTTSTQALNLAPKTSVTAAPPLANLTEYVVSPLYNRFNLTSECVLKLSNSSGLKSINDLRSLPDCASTIISTHPYVTSAFESSTSTLKITTQATDESSTSTQTSVDDPMADCREALPFMYRSVDLETLKSVDIYYKRQLPLPCKKAIGFVDDNVDVSSTTKSQLFTEEPESAVLNTGTNLPEANRTGTSTFTGQQSLSMTTIKTIEDVDWFPDNPATFYDIPPKCLIIYRKQTHHIREKIRLLSLQTFVSECRKMIGSEDGSSDNKPMKNEDETRDEPVFTSMKKLSTDEQKVAALTICMIYLPSTILLSLTSFICVFWQRHYLLNRDATNFCI